MFVQYTAINFNPEMELQTGKWVICGVMWCRIVLVPKMNEDLMEWKENGNLKMRIGSAIHHIQTEYNFNDGIAIGDTWWNKLSIDLANIEHLERKTFKIEF